MAVDKKFFVDINLQGNALNNATIGSNSDMTKVGSFQFNNQRLEYYDGSSVQEVANLTDIAAVTGGLILQGGYDAATNTPDIADGSALKGYFWVVTTAGSFLGESVQVGDSIIAKEDGAAGSIGSWLILQGNVVIATDTIDGIVRLATQAEVDSGTEGGAVVLTPATFANSQQLADINNNIAGLANDKLAIDGSQGMTGNLDMGGNDIANVNDTATASLSGIAGADISLQNNIDGNGVSNLVNIPAPTNGGDAANKTYVETFATTAANNAQAAAEATASADATTKANAAQANAESYADGVASTAESNANSYTDSVAATKLDLAGGTMSGGIDMAGNNITSVGLSSASLSDSLDANGNSIMNLPAPSNSGDATNKQYVDDAASTATTDANNYTDNLVNDLHFESSYADTDWTLSGGVYTLSVSHGKGFTAPKVSCYVSGSLVEFGVVFVDSNTIELKSNVTPPASVNVGVSI